MKKKPQDGEHPKILWDDSGIKSMYANITDVVASREEIKLLFGVESVWQAGQNETHVQLSAQIVIHPRFAKQVASVIDRTLRKYESRFGNIEQTHSKSISAIEQVLSPKEPKSGTEKGVEKCLELIRQVADLNVELAFECSFKTVQRQLFENRFLLGINRQDLEGKFEEDLTAVCRAINMPANLIEDFKRYLPEANHIYFGFEESEKRLLYKGYLEFRDRIEGETRRGVADSDSFLLYLGFKWDSESPEKQTTTRYDWFPALPVQDILIRLREVVGLHNQENLLEITESIVGQVSKKISSHDIQYLEATEKGSPRKSFDINIYKAKFKLEDLYPVLLKIKHHYSIPSERFQPLYERIKNERFGHLAGGLDRYGRDFLTVYHGVQYFNSHYLNQQWSARFSDGGG